MTYKSIIINLILAIIISFIIFHFKNKYSKDNKLIYSSVWCEGTNLNNRRCRFNNLCFKSDTNDFIFLYDNYNSIKYNQPPDIFNPALLELSSIDNHNRFYFNYVQIAANYFSNLSINYNIVNIKGKTFVLSRFKPDNLMHLFHDDILPLYFTLNQIGFNDFDNIFLNDDWPSIEQFKFSKYLFTNLFPHISNIFSRNEMKTNSIYCFDDIRAGVSKSTVWYQYGFYKPQSPVSKSSLDKYLISQIIRKVTNQLIPNHKCTFDYAIIISRKSTRLILNEDQLSKIVERVTRLHVGVVDVGEYVDYAELIKIINCAKIMIGMHGSGLILSMFLKPGSGLLELFPYAINPDNYTPYKTLTQLSGMEILYQSWRNTNSNNSVAHSDRPKDTGGISHLSEELQREFLSRTDDVPPHLCCSDSYWLFRIYQDTIVDDTVGVALESLVNKINCYQNTIPNVQLPPSHVLNANCTKKITGNNSAMFYIKWQQPWNVPFVIDKLESIQYELIIQKLPSNNAKSIITKEIHYQINDNKDSKFYIWINCQINQVKGPYIVDPIIC